MNDATPPRAQRKARWAERFWRGPDAVARANDWEIEETGWHGRRYRDRRFDQAATYSDEWPTRPMAPPMPRPLRPVDRRPIGFGEGHPRHHPLIPPTRGTPALLGKVWRWRLELGMAGAISASVYEFGAFTVAVLALVVIPPVRRAADRLVVRHRFQGLCLRTSLRTQRGRLPLVMNVTSTRDSVLLLVWCRSGMSVELFEDYIPEIRVACFAREVLIFPHYRWPHLLTMELRRP